MPLRTVVTIEGTVTTPSGVFASSFFDEGFAVQDGTAGIFVSFPNTDIGVQPPRHVEVTGVLQNTSGLLMIVPASVKDVKVKGKDKPVQPMWVRTGSVGESNQGSLVRAVGVITQGPIVDGAFGHKFFIDDGSGEITVFVNLGTNVDVAAARGRAADRGDRLQQPVRRTTTRSTSADLRTSRNPCSSRTPSKLHTTD